MSTKFYLDPKFWTAIGDAFVSTLAIVLAWYLSPDKVTQILTLIGLWQLPVAMIIAGIIQAQQTAIGQGVLPSFMKPHDPELFQK